jgi:hypothetical protein
MDPIEVAIFGCQCWITLFLGIRVPYELEKFDKWRMERFGCLE